LAVIEPADRPKITRESPEGWLTFGCKRVDNQRRRLPVQPRSLL